MSISPAGADCPYTKDTPIEEVLTQEFSALTANSSLSVDQKIAKVERAQDIARKAQVHMPTHKLISDLDDLKDKISKGEDVNMDHSAIRRAKALFRIVLRMVKKVDDDHPLLKEVPPRFLVFR